MTERMTVVKARKLLDVGKPALSRKKPKYGNTATTHDGIKFDSKKEANRYKVLKVLEQKGLIQDLQNQVRFVLAKAVRFSNESKAKTELRYYADFTYIRDGVLIVEDVKSVITRKKAEYRIKKHLMMSVHGLEISEV